MGRTACTECLYKGALYLLTFNVQSLRGAVCDTYYLTIAKVRERLSVSKQVAQEIDVEIQFQELK